MNIPKIAVDRPVAVTMVILLMVLMGSFGLTQLPLELMPDMDLPVIVVIAEFPGAGPSEVEDLVVQPLEESLQAVTNVSSITAISQDEEAQIIMEFEWGTDLDFAIQDVREQIDLVRDILPDDAEDPFALQYDPTEMPVLEFGVSGEGEMHEVRQVLDDDVIPSLERQTGVAEVNILGGQEREIQVEMMPDRLRRHNIAVFDVMESIYASNLDLPGGDVTLGGDEEYLVRTLGSFQSLEEIGDVPVPGGGGLYYLQDVADIYYGLTDQDTIVRLNGEESLGLTINQEADANTVETAEAVHDQLYRLQNELDYDLNFTIIQDQAEYIEVAIQTVVNNAVVGAILAVIILFLFLSSFSTTVIVAVTIPVAIIATFFLLFQAGLQLNMLTLGGLALGTGMLVDNSVVVTENIFRMREGGKKIRPAAIDGAVEVGVPIATSTFTTMAVFLPVVFIEGIAGEIFQDLSFSVAFSLLVSLIVALSLIPMLSRRLLARMDLEKVRRKQRESRVNRLLERLKTKYDKLIKLLLKKRKITVAVILGVFIITLAVAGWMGQEFLPEMDEGLVDVRVEMPPGTTLADTEERVARLEEEIGQWPDIRNVQSEVGVGGVSSDARMTVELVDLGERDQNTMDIVEEVRQLADLVPEADLEASNLSLVTGGGDEEGAPIVIDLLGPDRDELEEIGEELTARIDEMEFTTDVSLGVEEPRPELQVNVDRRQAGNYGLTGAEIAEGVNAAIDGEVVTRFEEEREDADDQQIDVRLRYGGGVREDIATIESMPLANAQGQIMPLDQVADLTYGLSPVELTRIDQTEAVSIYSDHVDIDLGGAVDEIEELLDDYGLPAGVVYEFGSETEWMRDAFDDLFFALLLAIVIVFMLLAGQFESLWQPLVVILSVPFGLVGVVFGLLLTGRSLNVASYIGVIMMVGIVVNNAIVLLDYINRQIAEGGQREDAISRACQIRLRPILMTTLTTVLAMFPLSLGIGEGAEVQAPIATAVIGGLLISTMSTLVVMPTLYTLFDDLSDKLKQMMSGKETQPDET